jgi:hypothetical protein
VTFPAIHASNLEHRAFRLPADFEGERNLLLIAFERDQQENVETWLPEVQRLLRAYPNLRFYQLPTIRRGNPLFRSWLDNAMRAGIHDRTAREQTITLYVDKEEFRRALELPHEQNIYALLVDRSGRVLWRADGLATPEKIQDLERVLKTKNK